MSDTADERTRPTVADVEAALGALVMAFSEIELRLQHLIWALLDDEAAGQIVTSAMPFKLAVAAAEQLWDARASQRAKEVMQAPEVVAAARERDPKASDAADYVFKALKVAEDERNKLLHSWWPDPDEPYWFRSPPLDVRDTTIRWKADRKSGRLKPHTVPLAEIRETAGGFITIANELATMVGLAMGPNYFGDSIPR